VAGQTDTVSVSLQTRCGVILDLWVQWFVSACATNTTTGEMAYPSNLIWTSPTPIAGHTSTVATAAGDYEYLPTLNWDSTGDYATFWSASAVPNPNLLCTVSGTGWDAGTAAGFAIVLIQYAYANKLLTGSLTGVIPGGTSTFQQVLQKAQDMMEIVWWSKDPLGFGNPGTLNLPRLNDVLWIPTQFGTGAMPNGEVIENGVTTFASARHSLYSATPEWAQLNTYLLATKAALPALNTLVIAGNWPQVNTDLATLAADTALPTPPSINYHRFWNEADVASAFACLAHYFPTLATPTPVWNTSITTTLIALATAATATGATTGTRTAAVTTALAAITTGTSSAPCITAVTAALNLLVTAVIVTGASAGVISSAIAAALISVYAAQLL